jgi:hypothetical protein
MNEAYLQLSDEKERIVLADNRLVHEGMDHISTMMSSLQESLQQRHDVLAANMDPINSPMTAESIRKLKTALEELHTRNAQLVMSNDELKFHLTFVPPKLSDTIDQARRDRSYYYKNQRTDPHYLHPSGGEYIFIRSELNDKITDQMHRCATVTSLRELLREADDVLQYLKHHNGIVDQPINDDENIVEDAIHMQLDGDANSPPGVMTAPDMRGGIPTPTAIDTPTVDATPTTRLRMIANNLDSNDSATKRTHNNTVPLGHKVHPSKVPRTNPQANLNTFNGMSTQGAQVHMANTHVTEPPMDTSNPFAPLGQNIVGYNVMRDDNSSSDNTSYKDSRWNSRLQVRNNGRGKGKGNLSRKGKLVIQMILIGKFQSLEKR